MNCHLGNHNYADSFLNIVKTVVNSFYGFGYAGFVYP